VSGTPDANGREQLDFPDTFCRDPALFDKAIERMRSGSESGMTQAQIEAALYRVTEQHYREDVTEEQRLAIKDLGKTYLTFDKLRREGRDSVCAYVARNLSRPLFLSASGGWASIVIGNPPWLAYRHMNTDLQKRFKELAKGERVYVGGKLATQNDLSALFLVRAAMLYLRSGGRIAFVLPLAALTRGQFERLRSGSFMSARIAWDEAWTMDESVWPLFEVPSCVCLDGGGQLREPCQIRSAPIPEPCLFATRLRRLPIKCCGSAKARPLWRPRLSRAARPIGRCSDKARPWCRVCCALLSTKR
jgi:hypothetical protein